MFFIGCSQKSRESTENGGIWSEHEDPLTRPDRIRTVKGFVAKEPVKGHMVSILSMTLTGSQILFLTFHSSTRSTWSKGSNSMKIFLRTLSS